MADCTITCKWDQLWKEALQKAVENKQVFSSTSKYNVNIDSLGHTKHIENSLLCYFLLFKVEIEAPCKWDQYRQIIPARKL